MVAFHFVFGIISSTVAFALHCEPSVPTQLSVYARLGQGSCHGARLLSPNSRLVVSVYEEDIAWLADLDMPTTVFIHRHDQSRTDQHDVPTHSDDWENSFLKVRMANQRRLHPVEFINITNVGDEAAAYLHAILQVYDQPPDAIVFVHAHQCAWHRHSDMHVILQSACLPAGGYLNLSPNGDTGWIDTTTCEHTQQMDDDRTPEDDRQQPLRSPEIGASGNAFIQLSARAHLSAFLQSEEDEVRQRAKGPGSFCREHLLRGPSWSTLFANELGSLPQRLYIDGNAEFAISKSRLLAHPRAFYQSLLSAVQQQETSMEYFWRAIFGT